MSDDLPAPAPSNEGPEPRAPDTGRPDPRALDTGRPELRASDADREQTAETLRRAMGEGRLTVEELEDRLRLAYSAPTVRELELLVADVTMPDRVAAGAVSSAHASGLSVREGPGGDRWVVSIMSGHDRKGRWRIAGRCTVLNIMGGATSTSTTSSCPSASRS